MARHKRKRARLSHRVNVYANPTGKHTLYVHKSKNICIANIYRWKWISFRFSVDAFESSSLSSSSTFLCVSRLWSHTIIIMHYYWHLFINYVRDKVRNARRHFCEHTNTYTNMPAPNRSTPLSRYAHAVMYRPFSCFWSTYEVKVV